MTELSFCKVCLKGDVRMQAIQSTELKHIYQLLAGNQLNAEDGRLHTICYICYSQLLRCCRFSDMCHKSDKIFQYLLSNGIEITEESVSKINQGNPYSLSVYHHEVISHPNLISITEPEKKLENVTFKAEELEIDIDEISVNNFVKTKTPEVGTDAISIDYNVKKETPEVDTDEIIDNIVRTKTPEVDVDEVSIDDIVKKETMELDIDEISIDNIVKKETMELDIDEISIDNIVKVETLEEVNTNKKDIEESIHVKSLVRVKPEECEETVEIEIDGLQYDETFKNPLEDANTEGVVNVPTTMLFTQLKKYIVDHTENQDISILDTTHNIPAKRNQMYNVCTICNKVINKRDGLDAHMKIHNGVKPYACNNCDQRFFQMQELKLHIRTEHTGFKKCICRICYRPYGHTSSLERHMLTHAKEEVVVCEVCSLPFIDKSTLSRHMKQHYPNDWFLCNDCPMAFNIKSLLEKHIKTEHSELMGISCGVCNKMLPNNIALQNHSLCHIDSKSLEQCNVCQKFFRDKFALNVHKAQHTKKPHTCGICTFKTAYKVTLKNHLLRVHNVSCDTTEYKKQWKWHTSPLQSEPLSPTEQ